MTIETLSVTNSKIAHLISDTILISTVDDGLDIVGNAYYQGFDGVILYEKNIAPAFFDLKTRMAGEILQKFSTYRIRLAIVGDFSKYQSKSLTDFIFESNKLGHINFVQSRSEAIEKLSN